MSVRRGIDGKWASGTYMPATKETRAVVLTERIESWQSPACLNEAMTRQQRAVRDQGTLWDMAALTGDTPCLPDQPERRAS